MGLLDDQLKQYSHPTNRRVPILSLRNLKDYPEGIIPLQTSNAPETQSQAKIEEEVGDKYYFFLRDRKFGPYDLETLRHYLVKKRIGFSTELTHHQSKKRVLARSLFPELDKASRPEKILNFLILMALSDGKITQDEVNLIIQYCKKNKLSEKTLREAIDCLSGDCPPPVSLAGNDLTPEDFKLFVKLSLADGKLTKGEAKLLSLVHKKLAKKYPEFKNKKLRDFFKA